MWFVYLMIVLIVWNGISAYSEGKLKQIKNEFFSHDHQGKKQDVESYKKHLFFVKFTNFMLEKFPWILASIVFVIGAGPVGLFFILFILWFKGSMVDINYRGYRTYKNRKDRRFRELDDWLVIANLTILEHK